MTPLQAELVIEKLVEKHGADCTGKNHQLVLKKPAGEPAIVHKADFDARTESLVCDLNKVGMKKGFTIKSWNRMGELLSKAVNEAAGKG